MKFLPLLFGALASTTTAFSPSFISHQAKPTSTALRATRRPFISGNWKLNPQTRDEAVELAKDISSAITSDSPDADVALFVPYIFIEAAMDTVDSKLKVGAEVRQHFFLDQKRPLPHSH